MIAYKFRLYPTREQEDRLNIEIERHRRVYNYFLEGLGKQKLLHQKTTDPIFFNTIKQEEDYNKRIALVNKLYGKINRGDIQHLLVVYKELYPEYAESYFHSLQYECWRLFRQLRSLSSRKKNGGKVGMMRFQGRDFFNSFSYNSEGMKLEYDHGKFGKLKLSKLGEFKIRVHRNPLGSLKHVTVKREGSKWFASLITDHDYSCVGLDLGLMNFVYDSYGLSWDNPKNLQKFAEDLKKTQQDLARKKKGSNNRFKNKQELSNLNSKIVRVRDDFLHKVSNYYASKYKVVVVEDLDIRQLSEKQYNSRNLMDASWGKFISMLDYKLKSRGGQLVKVDPKYTSQICNKCKNKKKMFLWDRKYKCEACGNEVDRDQNAAINILNKYLESLNSQELTSAESELDISQPSKEKEVHCLRKQKTKAESK